jgi:hypothetical protein
VFCRQQCSSGLEDRAGPPFSRNRPAFDPKMIYNGQMEEQRIHERQSKIEMTSYSV